MSGPKGITQGLWKRGGELIYTGGYPESPRVASIAHVLSKCKGQEDAPFADEQAANGRLIRAAPEMFRALGALLSAIDAAGASLRLNDSLVFNEAVGAARQALASAEIDR